MLGRALASILYRTGVIHRLQELWRQDLRRISSETRRGTQARLKQLKNELLEKELKAIRQAERALGTSTHTLNVRLAKAEDVAQRVTAPRLRVLGRRLKRLELAAIADARQSHLATAWAAGSGIADVLAHVARAVSAAAMKDSPSPHLIIDDLFPADFHHLLLTTLPEAEFFPLRRRSTRLSPANFRIVPSFTRVLWTFIDQEVAATMAKAVQQRLSPFIATRYGEWFGDRSGGILGLPHGAFGGSLTLWSSGYHDSPHFEPKRACATVFANIGTVDGAASGGMALYSLSSPVRPMQTTLYHPERHGVTCALAARVPLRPNAAIALLNAGCAHAGYVDSDAVSVGARQYGFEFNVGPAVPQLLRFVSKLPREDQQPWIGLMAFPDE